MALKETPPEFVQLCTAHTWSHSIFLTPILDEETEAQRHLGTRPGLPSEPGQSRDASNPAALPVPAPPPAQGPCCSSCPLHSSRTELPDVGESESSQPARARRGACAETSGRGATLPRWAQWAVPRKVMGPTLGAPDASVCAPQTSSVGNTRARLPRTLPGPPGPGPAPWGELPAAGSFRRPDHSSFPRSLDREPGYLSPPSATRWDEVPLAAVLCCAVQCGGSGSPPPRPRLAPQAMATPCPSSAAVSL